MEPGGVTEPAGAACVDRRIVGASRRHRRARRVPRPRRARGRAVEGRRVSGAALDVTGYSFGYDVTDAQGRTWDLKLGIEAQPEVVASRVLWAIGYHQPVMHLVPTWTQEGDEAMPQSSARFRLQSDHKSEGDWSWQRNPFVGTRQMKGLVAVNLVLNNWDLKDSKTASTLYRR